MENMHGEPTRCLATWVSPIAMHVASHDVSHAAMQAVAKGPPHSTLALAMSRCDSLRQRVIGVSPIAMPVMIHAAVIFHSINWA